MSSDVRRTRRTVFAGTAAAALLVLSGVMTSALPASASAPAGGSSGCAPNIQAGPTQLDGNGGIARPAIESGTPCTSPTGADPRASGGAPPLVFHNGNVMSTPKTNGRLVITPIYWKPAGYTYEGGYKSLINQYLSDAAHASDTAGNVFSTWFEYKGKNGYINYRIERGQVINDTTAFPSSGCTVNTGSVYSDGTGYTICLDEAQVRSEIDAQVTANTGTRDLGHIYAIFLPKHVETCFQPGNPVGQQCTINPSPSNAFCAYHSETATPTTVFANMPFPVYHSATGYTCSSEGAFGFGNTQSPNSNVNADVEVSPLSHEVSEAVTDPDVGTGWYDTNGFENGDECAYKYGTTAGSSGALYNQTINGHHYLTQEEFSNYNYNQSNGGCLQGYDPDGVPTVQLLRTTGGTTVGGNNIVINGLTMAGATGVTFGGTPATNLKLINSRNLQVTVPAHAAGTVDVVVTNARGSSTVVTQDHYTYS